VADLTGQIGICRYGTTWIAHEIEWATDSHTHHVVVAISPTECVSAEPGGVIVRTNAAYQNVTWSKFKLDDEQKAAIVAAGNASLKLPYNYAIYLPLFLSRLTHIPVPVFIAKWLGKRRNVDCSQLGDDIYHAAGIDLFTESSDIVTPGDFERMFQAAGFL
jgi:hypothetical protein